MCGMWDVCGTCDACVLIVKGGGVGLTHRPNRAVVGSEELEGSTVIS